MDFELVLTVKMAHSFFFKFIYSTVLYMIVERLSSFIQQTISQHFIHPHTTHTNKKRNCRRHDIFVCLTNKQQLQIVNLKYDRGVSNDEHNIMRYTGRVTNKLWH